MKLISQLINKKTYWGFGKTWEAAAKDITKNKECSPSLPAFAYEISDDNAHFEGDELIHTPDSALVLLGTESLIKIKEGLYRPI